MNDLKDNCARKNMKYVYLKRYLRQAYFCVIGETDDQSFAKSRDTNNETHSTIQGFNAEIHNR